MYGVSLLIFPCVHLRLSSNTAMICQLNYKDDNLMKETNHFFILKTPDKLLFASSQFEHVWLVQMNGSFWAQILLGLFSEANCCCLFGRE